jgi:hypothetical protein
MTCDYKLDHHNTFSKENKTVALRNVGQCKFVDMHQTKQHHISKHCNNNIHHCGDLKSQPLWGLSLLLMKNMLHTKQAGLIPASITLGT